MNERNFKVVKEFTTKVGLKAVILEMKWNDELKPISSLPDYYCGYVGVDINQPKGDVDDLVVHGGITYNAIDKKHPIPNKGLYFYGFDTCHYGDTPQKQNLKYCINECEKLAKQLV